MVAQIVTGQTRSTVIKNCTLRLDVYTSTYTRLVAESRGGNEYKYTCCSVRDVWSTQTFTVGSLPGVTVDPGPLARTVSVPLLYS